MNQYNDPDEWYYSDDQKFDNYNINEEDDPYDDFNNEDSDLFDFEEE